MGVGIQREQLLMTEKDGCHPIGYRQSRGSAKGDHSGTIEIRGQLVVIIHNPEFAHHRLASCQNN